MQIHYLVDHPDLIPRLARLHFAKWSRLRPRETLEERTSRLTAQCGRNRVPSVFVAVEDNGELAGSAMLVARDMDTRSELTPWLAGLYVVADRRGQGYGTALVQRVESQALELGVERLHLYTPDARDFYGGLGWALDERDEYLGQQVAVMSKRLDSRVVRGGSPTTRGGSPIPRPAR